MILLHSGLLFWTSLYVQSPKNAIGIFVPDIEKLQQFLTKYLANNF